MSIEVRPDDGEPIVVPGPVHTDPAEIDGTVDVVLLAVKDTQNEQAAAWLARLCDENTVVCALQNGVEQVERVGRFCPTSTVVPAAVWFSSETQPEGWVRLRTPVRLVLPDDPPRQAGWPDLLRGPRVSIDTDPDFVSATWRKLLTNAVAGLMVLTGRKSGMFRRDDVAGLARGTWPNASRWRGPRAPTSVTHVVDEIVGMFTGVPEDITTSMLTDREQGRPLEWDIRNGVIARKAAAARAGHADQRRPGAAARRRERRTGLTTGASEATGKSE